MTKGESQATASCEQLLTVTTSIPGPQCQVKLGNGTILCFSKQSVPDPPWIKFASDIPHLMRI
jgi:hypothetical protein